MAMGTTTVWRILPTWRQALDAPAAAQMGMLKKIFLARKEWWLLVPDQTVFASGGRISDAPLPIDFATDKERSAYVHKLGPYQTGGKPTGNDLLHLAARHRDGKWAMIYLSEKASFSVNMNKINSPKVNVSWVNPSTGAATPAGQESNTGVKSYSTPDGWEDALLILEAAGGA